MESFWGMMKSEMYNLKKFNTYEVLETAIMKYIEYNNNYWYQKKLNCMTPLMYRRQFSSIKKRHQPKVKDRCQSYFLHCLL